MKKKDRGTFAELADGIINAPRIELNLPKELVSNEKLLELDNTFKLYCFYEGEQDLVSGDTERLISWMMNNLDSIADAIKELRTRRNI